MHRLQSTQRTQVMPMKPRPNKHDRRGYNQSPGNVWRALDDAQEQAKKSPGSPQYPNGTVQGYVPYHDETRVNPNNGVAKKSKPKVFSTSAIERSIVKALEPVLQVRDATVYSFDQWTLCGSGFVICLPNGQEFRCEITEAK